MNNIIITLALFSIFFLINSARAESHLGIEFNPYMAAVTVLKSNEIFISGGGNYFIHDKKMEVALPLIYSEPGHVGMTVINHKLKVISGDLVLRKYFHIMSWLMNSYIGVFGRYTILKGTERKGTFEINAETISEKKIGFGINIGIRKIYKINKLNYYWGASIFLGRYIKGNNDMFGIRQRWFLHNYDQKEIIDFEIAKLGLIF